MDFIRILLGLAALTALLRKVDILYIVPVGAVISVFISNFFVNIFSFVNSGRLSDKIPHEYVPLDASWCKGNI